MQAVQGYYRLWDIIGCKKRKIKPLIPLSRSSWLANVGNRFPKPVKLTKRTTAWRVEDIQNLIEQLNKKGAVTMESK